VLRIDDRLPYLVKLKAPTLGCLLITILLRLNRFG